MPIFSIKKAAAAISSIGPAGARLNAHLAAIRFAEHERGELHARANAKRAALVADKAAVDQAAAEVTGLQSIIDVRMAEANRAGRPDPDLAAEREALAAAQRKHERQAEIHRGAANEQTTDQSQINSINQQVRELCSCTPAFLHPAVVEKLTELAPEFREAEEALRAIHAKVFAHVVLADQLATENRLGEFYGQQSFSDLLVSRPAHPAYHRGSTDPWTAQQERNAEWKAVGDAAARLNHEMLNGEAEG